MRRRQLLAAALGLGVAACQRAARDRLPGAGATSPPPGTAGPTPTPSPTPTSPSGRGPSPSPGGTAGGTPGTVTVPLICRDAWGARPPRSGLGRHTVRRIMVHHDAVVLADDRRAPERLRSHQRHHLRRGWGDIAYHVAVDRAGHAYELRRPAAPGATATAYDPTGWFLPVALGDFEQQAPARPQLETLARILAWAADGFGSAPADVAAHRDHAATACPGDALYAALPRLRRRAARLRGRVALRRLCGRRGRARVAAIEAGRA